MVRRHLPRHFGVFLVLSGRRRFSFVIQGESTALDGRACCATIAGMSPTDEQLAAAIRQRDASAAHWQSAQDACAELYRRHARSLVAFLASRVRRADLDDMHQTIWERVWRCLPESFAGGNFRAWLYQIARSRLIDAARKKRPDRLADDHDPPDPRRPARRRAAGTRATGHLAALPGTPGRAPPASSCARLSGLDYETIGKELGLQPSQAHKLFHTAKKQLRDCVRRSQA